LNRRVWRAGIAGAVVTALAVALMPGARAGEGAAKKHGPIAWTESLAVAQKRAAKEKKVVLADFWAEWCVPCKKMLATTYKEKEVVARAKKFIPALIDFDKNKEVAKKYNIEALPTLLFLDAKGNVLVRSTAYLNKADMLKLMDEALKKAKP
jgi:thiol:disulfide interchange protein